jgi:hypothetical protein
MVRKELMTTETPRVALFQRLNEVLGPDHASTLMIYLPTEQPATKSDITDLKSVIKGVRAEISGLKSDLRETEQRFNQRMDGIDRRLMDHDLRFDNIHEAIRQQTRAFILATTATMVTLSALAFGAAALI